MELKQFYLGCLAQASYLVSSRGEAAVIDPRRDVDLYMDEATACGARITYVVETHLHADFVSGHQELAERTGATIVFGHRALAQFPHRAVREGDELRVGAAVLRILETPGHTPEGISIVVVDEEASPDPVAVFTGDTLFVGDVGRPDLAGGHGKSASEMASLLFDSLHQKLLTLPDEVAVYPAHGAGSLCGKNISRETSSTIGEQRQRNHALQPMSREAFVALVTADQLEVPRYFARDVAQNREGAAPLFLRPGPAALSPRAAAAALETDALALDVRPPDAFGAAHVPGAVNIGLDGQFASWAGTLIAAERPVVLIGEDVARVEEAAMRLARVGLENVAGYVAGGLGAWQADDLPVAQVGQVEVRELDAQRTLGRLQILDVRRSGEYSAGHVPGALNRPLDRIESELSGLDPLQPTAVICAGGYRSSAAASLLLRHGFKSVRNVTGGTSAWIAAGLPVER